MYINQGQPTIAATHTSAELGNRRLKLHTNSCKPVARTADLLVFFWPPTAAPTKSRDRKAHAGHHF